MPALPRRGTGHPVLGHTGVGRVTINDSLLSILIFLLLISALALLL